jgi:hypothetical protein
VGIKVIEIKHPRKTFIKGTLRGKYWASADELNLINTNGELFNLNIYEAEIRVTDIHKNDIGEFDDFKNLEPTKTKLPSSIILHIKTADFREVSYSVCIHEPKFKYITLDKIVTEPDQRFGRIKAEVQGYILDEISEYIEVEEPVVTTTGGVTPVNCIQDELTGKADTKDRWSKRYIRYQYYNSDCSTYWGKWVFKERIEAQPSLELGKIILWLLLVLFVILWIFTIGWKSLAIIGLVIGLVYFRLLGSSIISTIFRWGIRLLSILFLFGVLASFVSYFKTNSKRSNFPKRNDYEHSNSVDEITDTLKEDQIISHHRSWQDYDNHMHECNLKIYKSDYLKSNEFNQTQFNSADFKSLYARISQFDLNKLDLIYKEFDSLRISNNYTPRSPEFAKLIVSCIQDIPYALVLPYSCNPFGVNDKSIKELLLTGCDCKAFVPNGLQTPTEFMGDLKGDCDTRSLLLFMVLNKFEYKTLVLASDFYKHAIIAVNIPNYYSNGIKIKHQNELYYVWETTAPNVPIGVLSPEVDNMNLWSIYLN